MGKEKISIRPFTAHIRSRNLPFDVPESIRKLALRPRILKLLRRRPFSLLSPFPPLNSLFRWITGVSATGSATFVPSGGCAGELYPFDSDTCACFLAFGGRPAFFGFFVSGWCSGLSRVREERIVFVGSNSGSVCVVFAAPLVGLLVGSSTLLPFSGTALEVASSPVCFLRGRPLFGVDLGGAFSTSEWGFSRTASIDGLGFFDGSRANWNPSASSSYVTERRIRIFLSLAQQFSPSKLLTSCPLP
jgi:hypothetical protein